ncbi:hypothetical protein Acr_06g0013840 [Actinidia rufa]|uniref:Uncharacterized protein n=1 Tax=Actinidia rufa TaxID=165716 RepID=A0A7J0ESI5_9ERIC|nr:hypothetical protein Acr_06g0013840 [Actinidia rufa]
MQQDLQIYCALFGDLALNCASNGDRILDVVTGRNFGKIPELSEILRDARNFGQNRNGRRLYHFVSSPRCPGRHGTGFTTLRWRMELKESCTTIRDGVKFSWVRLSKISPNLADKIKMVEITLPLVNGLPEGCEPPTLKSSKYHTSRRPMIYYKHHSKNSVHRQSPDFIFLDFVPCWVPEIAAKFGIGSAFFSAFTAATLAYLGPPAEIKPKRNAKLLLEKGVGYEVPRKEDGSFNPDAVAESVRLVMGYEVPRKEDGSFNPDAVAESVCCSDANCFLEPGPA